MRNSALPERLQKLRRRIRLDRIKRFARKLFSKESSSPTCSLRTNKRYRLNRLEGSSYPQRAMLLVQFTGPPVGYCGLTSCVAVAVPWGSGVRYIPPGPVSKPLACKTCGEAVTLTCGCGNPH